MHQDKKILISVSIFSISIICICLLISKCVKQNICNINAIGYAVLIMSSIAIIISFYILKETEKYEKKRV